MKMRYRLGLIGLSVATVVAVQAGNTRPNRITVTIDASKTGPLISPYLYGQFIEHIGPLIDRSVWAETLDDRRFHCTVFGLRFCVRGTKTAQHSVFSQARVLNRRSL